MLELDDKTGLDNAVFNIQHVVTSLRLVWEGRSWQKDAREGFLDHSKHYTE